MIWTLILNLGLIAVLLFPMMLGFSWLIWNAEDGRMRRWWQTYGYGSPKSREMYVGVQRGGVPQPLALLLVIIYPFHKGMRSE